MWTNAFTLGGNNSLAIATSAKLTDSMQKDAGVLGVSVRLSELSELLSTVPIGTLGSAIILDSNLNEIAVSERYSSNVAQPSDASIAPWKTGLNAQQAKAESLSIDGAGHPLAYIDKDWFSPDGAQVNVQRRIKLFDGALQWRVILQSQVAEIDASTKQLVWEDLYQKIAIVLLPGLLALLVVIGLRGSIHRLHRRATIDFLTRALNREEFHARLTRRLLKARSGKGKPVDWIAVVIDLDGFKQINDQHGHDAGDAILVTVVSRLQQKVGRYGFVGRLGGDEFAVALKVAPGVDTRAVVEHLRHWVVRESIRSAKGEHFIGMTAGLAVAEVDDTSHSLLDKADQALVQGKAIEKNRTYIASLEVPAIQKTKNIQTPSFQKDAQLREAS